MITIIILLILAAVSIATLTGENGLLERAKQAAEETKYSNAEEKVKLAVIASYGNSGTIEDNLLKENINKIQGLGEKIDTISYDLTVKVDGYEFKISKLGQVTCIEKSEPTNTEAGKEMALDEAWKTETMRYVRTADGEDVKELTKVATVYAISDGTGNKVPVPYGFHYVGGTVDSGVVISDNEADKNRYKGRTDVGKDLIGNQFVWIPCDINEYRKYDWGYTRTSYDSRTSTAEKTQIQKYKGFYVGRYEAGTSEIELKSGKKIGDEQLSCSSWQNSSYVVENTTNSSMPTTKANEIPYYAADIETSEIMSERMYNTNYVNSGLITGTQWDVMLNFMSDENDKSVENASNSSKYMDLKTNCIWGNYSDITLNNCEGKYCLIDDNGSMQSLWNENTNKTNKNNGYYNLLTTGSTEEVKRKNLYDVAGNLWENTHEVVRNSRYISFSKRRVI